MTLSKEARNEPSPDISSGSSDENVHCGLFSTFVKFMHDQGAPMIRPSLSILALTLIAATGCDRTNALAVTPALEEETSFEQGLDGWGVDLTPATTGSGAITGGEASAGSSYVRITLAQGADFVWLERQFTLEPSTSYNVTLSADLRTFEGAADVRVYAGAADPDGSGFSSEGPVPASWTRTLSPRPLTTDAQGRVWVALGISGTGQAGAFGVDQLGAVFLRAGS